MEYDLNVDILPTLPWQKESANRDKPQRVTIYYFSLTTCVYCKKGMNFLKENNIAFNWLYLEKLELDHKQAIKKWVQQRAQLTTRMASPFVIFRLDDHDFISNGYDPDYWKSKMR